MPPLSFVIETVAFPVLYPVPTLVMLTVLILLLALKVTVPANPLPPPAGEPLMAYDLPAVVKVHFVPGLLAALMQPGLFIATVAVALLIVLVLGIVAKFTVGVIPEL